MPNCMHDVLHIYIDVNVYNKDVELSDKKLIG